MCYSSFFWPISSCSKDTTTAYSIQIEMTFFCYSIISEKINNKKLVNLSIPDKFIFENLGREMLLDKNGLSVQNILKKLKKIIT